jgi:4-amino-4-deoxy-L-arabinose transferase-like glycosyltransferase
MRKINFIIILILTIASIYRLFFGLGDQPIERWDEKANINVVSDTITRNSFPVLYLGEYPFFEKPPLWYYVNFAIAKTFGISPTSVRVTSAVSGFFIILISAYIAWRWWGKIAMIATWVVLLSTNQLLVTNAGGYFATHTLRSADLDALQIFFIVIAFVSAVEFKNNRFVPLVLGVSSGLAVLTKGPVGLLPIVLFTGLVLIKKGVERRRLIVSWITSILVLLPWYVLMLVKFGYDFLQANIGYHIAERVLIPLEGHEDSVWFYLKILASRDMFVLSFFLLPAFIWVIVNKKYRDARLLFLVLMVVSCFVIPSLVQTKLAWYILPIYPFAAMLIGVFFGKAYKEVTKKI